MIQKRKWFLGSIVVLVLATAWRYPWVGFMVPVVVMAGLSTSLFRGRFFCGNWCPRGAFLDSLPVPVQRWQRIPAVFKNRLFRWGVVLVLFSVMIGRGLHNPASVRHWGLVFWQMCLVTTGIALVLAVLFRPRAWCAICPVGTLQGVLGGRRFRYQISNACTGCGLCEKSCPLSLPIVAGRDSGYIESSDCLKCGRCRTICPAGAIREPSQPTSNG